MRRSVPFPGASFDREAAVVSGPQPVALDVAIVGAGFAGLFGLHRMRGLGLRTRVFERGAGVGGTWYWNRYPGARCDIESLEYSYQFSEELQQEWHWTERFATQPEILRYAEHVAERFDLMRDIQLETSIDRAAFDDATASWSVTTDRGESFSARYLILATGCLSSTNLPDFEGLADFAGETYHTGRWPHDPVDFRGKRVGVVGTGSSAIQSIPLIAQDAASLHVFQRTANYSIPAHNAPLDPEHEARVKADYRGFRAHNAQLPFGAGFAPNEQGALEVSQAERDAEYESRWQTGGLGFLSAYADLLFDAEANRTAGEFLRRKIHEIVRDPEVAALLSPDQVVGCKRLCVDTGYFDTFNRENVTLVDVRSAPIRRITKTGLETADAHYDLDMLVLATGFDAMTGSALRIDIRGPSGQTLGEKWAEGPRTYLGLATSGFPNFFTVTGPGSPSVLSNMIPSIEQHVNWIADCIGHLEQRGLKRIEATREAEESWVAHVNEVADETLYPSCNSWYLGANVPGKPRVFMPYLGFPPYVEKCDEVASNGYEGFLLS